jgi:threonine dehydratase
MPPTLVSLEDVRRAAEGLRGVAVRTPLVPSEALSERFGVPVFLKPEMLQRGGAFKFRGAYWYVSQLSAADRARGLVAPSSGNHGQAVALAARLFGVRCTVVMPTTAPRAKRAGAERLGARVIFEGTTTAERMAKALEIRDSEGATLVPPFDDPTIIAGQGTIGLEIA